jgi:riboflavin kinase / FMN adenylyltransferase
VVVRGDQRGRQIGFPTANLLPSRYAAVPADAVYAGWLVRRPGARGGSAGGPARIPAAISIGTNPTFTGRERRTEAYALDFDGDLYGERLALDFVARLREQRRYEGVAELIAQIDRDVADTRAALALG